MNRHAKSPKHPHSVQLYQFCHLMLQHRDPGRKIQDQEIAALLDLSPSDGTHWKQGAKNVIALPTLRQLAERLGITADIPRQIVLGTMSGRDGHFLLTDFRPRLTALALWQRAAPVAYRETWRRISEAVDAIHHELKWISPPLYFPEVLVQVQDVELEAMKVFSEHCRTIRGSNQRYRIQVSAHHPETAPLRLHLALNLGRIITQPRRSLYPVLGARPDTALLAHEVTLFALQLYCNRSLCSKVFAEQPLESDALGNVAKAFWVPTEVVSFHLGQEILERIPVAAPDRTLPARSATLTAS